MHACRQAGRQAGRQASAFVGLVLAISGSHYLESMVGLLLFCVGVFLVLFGFVCFFLVFVFLFFFVHIYLLQPSGYMSVVK